MFVRKKLELFVVCFILQVCSASIHILRTIDESVLHQLENPDPSPIGIAHLLEDLTTYKKYLYKLIIIFAQEPKGQEIDKGISVMESPVFLTKALDFNNLKKAYNLSEINLKVVSAQIKGILMNWKQLKLVVSSDPPFKDNPIYLPFYLIENSGKRLAYILDHALPSQSQEMFIEFCTYYYALGKLLKLLQTNDKTCLKKCEDLYQGEKPLFLQKYIGIKQIMYKMGLSDSERSDLETWIKLIYVRWFKFINIYKKIMNISDGPNFTNLQILKKTDDALVNLIKKNSHDDLQALIEGLKTFNKYLRLIMRRNYPFRPQILKEARLFYKIEDPLFLRQVPNITVLQTNMNINIKSLAIVQHFIDQIKYKWPFFVGLQEEVIIPPKKNRYMPITFKLDYKLLTTTITTMNIEDKKVHF